MDVHILKFTIFSLTKIKYVSDLILKVDKADPVSSALLCFWLICSLIDINTVFVLLLLTMPNVLFQLHLPSKLQMFKI